MQPSARAVTGSRPGCRPEEQQWACHHVQSVAATGGALYFFDAVDDMGQELGWSLSSL
ncbi:hypothetical protein XOC_0677 [Xanthomonas oryzae pv. oryzicola BLS256]|uniref:Uncharacterized protein n=1 Tax=Xanthomonas oryzae pv. oryzicola (strain BLS256) TaxID=383407 RepID=G7TBK5_XANOB|nr:hypothetical protein XOC_0677 [Xanthomonas oryzae pv. oryzicola BLS256]